MKKRKSDSIVEIISKYGWLKYFENGKTADNA